MIRRLTALPVVLVLTSMAVFLLSRLMRIDVVRAVIRARTMDSATMSGRSG